jgi:hypothetical protein
MKYVALLVVLLISGCATTHEIRFSADDAKVESWESVDPAPMNAQISAAVRSGEDWPASPLEATIRLFGGDRDTRIVRFDESKNRTEGADTTVVVLIRDGFLDDSVRGDWNKIIYELQTDRTWRIQSVQRAYRCYRGQNQDSYTRMRCP